MEEVGIVWQYPNSLEEPYKGWAEDFIRNYVHRGIRPKYKDFDRISRLLVELSEIDIGEHPKYYNMNRLALEFMIGEFESWINRGEEAKTKKLAPTPQFNPRELLPKFDSYNINGDRSLKLMDLSGTYWDSEYPIGTLIFKNNEEGPGLEFNSIIMGHRLKTYALEGFEAKQIGIGSHLAYNSDEDGKPNLYFLPGTNGQILNPAKKEILV
jgi:hypothetical protein